MRDGSFIKRNPKEKRAGLHEEKKKGAPTLNSSRKTLRWGVWTVWGMKAEKKK